MKIFKKRSMIIAVIFIALFGSAYLLYDINKKNEVIIHYAAWNLGKPAENSMERQMIDAFMKKHPNVKIVIDETFVDNYNEAMNNAVMDGDLPDVFMYSGNAIVEENNWCKDLTDIVESDSEWSNIPEVLRDSTYIKGKIIAIPSAVYLYGYYCNNDVIEKAGLQDLASEISVEAFSEYVKRATRIDDGYIGLAYAGSICEWYPSAMNERYGWFSWDGGKFNLSSEEFRKGIDFEKELVTGKYSFELLGDNEKDKLNAKNDWDAWNNGSVAFKFDGTWCAKSYADALPNVSFVGMPGGRICVVPDFLFVSRDAKNAKEAYEFAKYMSAYSKEGVAMRVQLASETNMEVTTVPMVKDANLLEDYFKLTKMPGIEEEYRKWLLDPSNSFVETTKILPGYSMARWNYMTGYTVDGNKQASIGELIQMSVNGEIEYSDIAEEINYLANSSISIYPQQLGY
jgi:multiple sugar transport system substrate-binding protein